MANQKHLPTQVELAEKAFHLLWENSAIGSDWIKVGGKESLSLTILYACSDGATSVDTQFTTSLLPLCVHLSPLLSHLKTFKDPFKDMPYQYPHIADET